MTIDTAITVLGMVGAHGICIEAKNIAVDTMRKYQKIEQLIGVYEEYKWERIDVKDIREILDGNSR